MSQRIVSFSRMRLADRDAMERVGISEEVLMENAGIGIASLILERLGRGRNPEDSAFSGRVFFAIGPGNNGGDGLAAMRHLAQAGVQIHGFLISEKFSGAAGKNFRIAKNLKLPLDVWEEGTDAFSALNAGRGDVIVDSIFGTGISRPPSGPAASMIRSASQARRRGAFILSVDVPSGLGSGGVFLPAISADETACLGFLKSELCTGNGADLCGSVRLVDISIPKISLLRADELDGGFRDILLEAADGPELLPVRRPGFHKGEGGHVAVISGAEGKSGAAALAAIGALKSGAGLVTVIGRQASVSAVQARCPALMGWCLKRKCGPLGMGDLPEISEALEGKQSLVVGPGLQRGRETLPLLGALLEMGQLKSILLDADALNAISDSKDVCSFLSRAASPIILTPHPLEMARLLRKTVQEIQGDRIKWARSLARSSCSTVVLKGKGTVIASPDGTAAISLSGCPGMATAGSGDLLAGIAAALTLQAGTVIEGVRAAVLAHGLAGELASDRTGQLGLTAPDLADGLALVWRSWRR